MKTLRSRDMLWIFVSLVFLAEAFAIIPCEKQNITYSLQNDAITVHFSSNDLLKLHREVRCARNASGETVHGCSHRCANLGYGQIGQILVDLRYDNGTNESCPIDYQIGLLPPTLAFFDVPGDRIRLGVRRPEGSFDSVNVECSDEDVQVAFNSSAPSSGLIVIVDCAFTPNLPLKSITLVTLKQDFRSAITEVNEEVPLPVPFNVSLNSTLLTIRASAPPTMNLKSTCQLEVRFYDKNDATIIYERAKVIDIDVNLVGTFYYNLIPNLKHQITFMHIVNSTFYAISTAIVTPASTVPYPSEVTDLRVREEFQTIVVSWNDPHSPYDPVEFVITCNSNTQIKKNVGRNTSYVCENMQINDTGMISVETHLAITNYVHDRVPIASIALQDVPPIPMFEAADADETNITVRWTYDVQHPAPRLFQYRIQCGLNAIPVPFDIHLNEYQCQSLEPGTLYVITMLLINADATIRRVRSIQANTMLEPCQYQNHVYFRDHDGTRTVLIEWRPPEKNFEKIYILCPATYITLEQNQVMSQMYSKCTVADGVPFNVTCSTFKSGFELATAYFSDTAPIDVSTTTAPFATITTATTSGSSIAGQSTTTTTTGVTSGPGQSTTTTIGVTSGSGQSTTTTTTSTNPNSTTSAITGCPDDDLLKARASLTRWRTTAIIALIIGGFLALSTILLIVFSVILCLRYGYDIHDQY